MSRSGAISSMAVAKRITPWRCRLPSGSIYARGRVNSNSVCRLIVRAPAYGSLLSRDVLVDDGDLFHADLVAVGLGLRAADLGRPGAFKVPAGLLGERAVVHHDRAALARALHVAVLDHLAPLPEVHARG